MEMIPCAREASSGMLMRDDAWGTFADRQTILYKKNFREIAGNAKKIVRFACYAEIYIQ